MIDPMLAAQADRILGLTQKRARRRRRAKPQPPPQQPIINVTVHVPAADRPRRRGVEPSNAQPGRGRRRGSDLVANGRGRERRIGPSPG